MKKLYTVIALVAVLVIGGIGYNVLQAKDEQKSEPQKQSNQVTQQVLDGKLSYILTKDDEGVVTVELKNVSDEDVTLNYTSSQAYDYRLYKDGKVAYHWSASAGFLAVMTDKTLAPGESEVYTINTKELPVDPGTYELEFYSVAKELANEPKVSITLDLKETRQSPLPEEPAK